MSYTFVRKSDGNLLPSKYTAVTETFLLELFHLTVLNGRSSKFHTMFDFPVSTGPGYLICPYNNERIIKMTPDTQELEL